jgi:hypothetical protein
MARPVFLSLAPRLLSEEGHDVAYHTALQQVVQSLSMDFRALISQGATLPTLSAGWVKFFRKDGFRIGEFARVFLSGGRQRVLFMESFTTRDLCAFALAALLFATRTDRVWLLFRYDFAQLPMSGRIHLLLAKWLHKRMGNRFVPLTDSQLIQQSQAGRLPLHILPIPHTEPTEASAVRSDGPLVLWWPGMPRRAKGLREIAHLACASPHPGVELVVADSTDLPSSAVLRLRKIATGLSRERYLQQMARAHVVLLPYDPSSYRVATSGIFVEAVIAGKMPVVKSGSWLAHELERFHLEELIIDWSKKDVPSELVRLYQDGAVRSKLQVMQAAYRSFHSLEAYRQKVAVLLNS